MVKILSTWSKDPMLEKPLIHGGMFADMYEPLVSQPVLANIYRLVSYHRRGYAGSSHNVLDGVSIEQQAADCKELMRTLDIDHAHIVAHANVGLIIVGSIYVYCVWVRVLSMIPEMIMAVMMQEYQDPSERYINQPEKPPPAFHTQEFMIGYHDGFESCGG